MKILKIIHGYPPYYNAGSEVYSQILCHGLEKNHQVFVLTREENPFLPAFNVRTETDYLQPAIKLHIVNIPSENFRYRYQNLPLDAYCDKLLSDEKPDVVHIGHLNHLSTSLVEVIHKANVPIVFTLHDYWLMCPRGQFIQRNAENKECWRLCDKQEDERCARNCYAGYFSGAAATETSEINYWTHWVSQRMQHIKSLIQYIDCFIAPSQYLADRFTNDFVIPKNKLQYLDYGFDLKRILANDFSKKTRMECVFGYIGTHIPAKGIQDLIQAFGQLKGQAKLIIWGKARGYNTTSLKMQAKQIPVEKQNHIEWREEYANETIMAEVFQHIDCLVVPSIWVENSPLVIHEAQQARIPVITADVGGMKEYVEDGTNGLLFKHRDINSLAQQMQKIVDNPTLANTLGNRGYLYSQNGDIPSIEEHVKHIEAIYHRIHTGRTS